MGSNMTNQTNHKHRIVIIGGGFAGLTAARALAGNNEVEITLLDKRNFHLFQPLLYQVATGALSPANIAAPLRAILSKQKNVRVLLAEATRIDPTAKQVILDDSAIPYDTVIVGVGVRHSYFGHDQWEKVAPGLKTLEDATEIRRRILFAFEAAEREPDPAKQAESMTFVVIGGGPTGVELAGAVGEIAHHTLKGNFRNIDTTKASVILLEGVDRLLLPYTPELSQRAAEDLQRLGVEVRLNSKVTDIQADHLTYEHAGRSEQIRTRNILWSAGVQGTPLGKQIAAATGAALDRMGRIEVGGDLTIQGYPDVLILGDMAAQKGADGKVLPGVAQVAMQQGQYAAKLIKARLRGRTIAPFVYVNLGKMATIGRNAAVAEIGPFKLAGFIGWLVWLFIHIMYIVEFENRLMIIFQWAWGYFTLNRAARLITGRSLPSRAALEIAVDNTNVTPVQPVQPKVS